MSSRRLNFLCLSSDPKVSERCQKLASEFEYSFHNVVNAESVVDLDGQYEQIQFVLINAIPFKKKEEIAGFVQTVRQVFKDAFICVVADRKSPADVAIFIKKSGASLILLENELMETSRLEFVASQVIRASYIPVKVSEFAQDSVLDFSLFHLMPLNQKFLAVLPKGTALSEARIKKLETVGEVYVRRDEVDRYRHYVETHPSMAGAIGLRSRCRAQYLSLCNSHTQLIFNLIDQSEDASFKEGKWLAERCENLAKDLLSTLSAVGEAWEVVNNSSLGEFGSVERAPTLAAYAGLLSLMASLGEPVDVMSAALLCDVGMLELHPEITAKIRRGHGLDLLNEDEMDQYRKHPLISLNRCLQKKLNLKEDVKEMILCSHERVDAKGFPQGRESSKIPLEAMLIQFSEMMDQGAMIRMGQARVPVQEVRKNIHSDQWKSGKIFSLVFLQKIKPLL